MITSLRLKDFKNFQDAELKLGPVTTLVGANGAGKSNLCDALRFVHGIGRGYSLTQIFGGVPGAGSGNVWEGIRGGAAGCARDGQQGFSITIQTIHVSGSDESLVYEIAVKSPSAPEEPSVRWERLEMEDDEVFSTEKVSYSDTILMVSTAGKRVGSEIFRNSHPVLCAVSGSLPDEIEEEEPEDDDYINRAHYLLGALESTKSCLQNIRFYDFEPGQLRKPCAPGQSEMGPRGDNLSGVLQRLLKDEKHSRILLGWIDALLPQEVSGIEVVSVSPSTVQLALREPGGNLVDGDRVSDGTLRFLGFLVVLMTAEPGQLLFLEEVENGIHPSRLHLLIELIESQARKQRIQVVLTTHSPNLLDCLDVQSREHVYIAYRNEEGVSGVVRRLMDLPNAASVIRDEGLGAVYSTSWIEDILAFTEPRQDGETE